MHQPVLLQEVITHMNIQPDGKYVDCTFGRGGHSKEILKHLGENGRLLALDKDDTAILAAQQKPFVDDPRFSIKKASFSALTAPITEKNWQGKINGILMDIGVSSPQLDTPERGFSFTQDGPLDMRMDPTQTLNAADWINTASEKEIASVLKDYGEERFYRRITNAIVKARAEKKITRTLQLAEIVSKAHPKWEKHKHPATRVFQAIRIFINAELEELKKVLEAALDMLAPQGRLLVISFHSLEHRIVKAFIKKYTHSDIPRGLPITQAEIQSHLKLKTINGVITPSEQELAENPRARSAALRIMEKIS